MLGGLAMLDYETIMSSPEFQVEYNDWLDWLDGLTFFHASGNRKERSMTQFLEGLNSSQKIGALLASQKQTVNVLSKLLGRTGATIYARMKDESWTVKEIRTIAKRYRIDPKDLI